MSKATIIPLNIGDGLTLTASAALVVDGNNITLVDPAGLGSLQNLQRILDRKNLNLNEINQVFYTHLHFDHYDRWHFPEHIKRVFIPEKEVSYINNLMQHQSCEESYKHFLINSHEKLANVFVRQFCRYRNDARYEPNSLTASKTLIHYDGESQISDHCKTLPLPGHCVGLHGLEIELQDKRCVIASDAVLDITDWRNNDINRHLILSNSKQWWQSRNRLKDYEWLLPGHGGPFNPQTNMEH